ncbi:hypothetical protein ES703_03509 [subsurface metagenome]
MKKLLYVTGGIILLISIVIITGDRDKKETTLEQQSTQKQSEQIQPRLSWYNVISFQGDAGKTTETFKVSSDEWKIDWSYDVENYGGFTVWLKKLNDKNYRKLLVADSGYTNQGDTTYIYQGNDVFYFDITAINEGWTIEVEEKK